MENKIISINISPGNDEEINENAGVMWEHNATSLVFSIDPAYVDDYRYYIEYRSLIGTKVRTEYLELNVATNTVTYDIPVTMTCLRGVECYFNIVKIDEDGQTVQVIKPKKFYLQFDYSPDTDNTLAKENDFSINALLEAIRLGVFQGGSGGTVVVDSKMSDVSSNPIQNKIVKAYIDKIADSAIKLMDQKDQIAVNSVVKYLEENYISKEDEIANIKISGIAESTQDGGSNIVTFSDGNTLTVKNGSKGSKGDKGEKGDAPIKGTDYFTESDKKEIKDESIALISRELAKRGQLKPEFANNTEECADETKLYVLPDGFIYAYMYNGAYPEITIEKIAGQYFWYNGGKPKLYSPSEDASTKRTNLISVNEGDILKITLRGTNGHTCNGCWYDENENMISPIMVEEPDQDIITTELTVPIGAKYVQLYSMNYNDNIDSVVLEVEWVYCAASLIPQWANTGHAFVPADYEAEILDHENRLKDLEGKTVESILKGKKIVYDGDSLCAPWGSENGGAYPQIIADLVGCNFDNQAVGGGRIATRTDGGHSIVDNLVNLPIDGDLYCFEGGCNDHWNGTSLGDFSATDYTGELDTTTFCGALETIFRYSITNFIGKPICFIITHKCGGQNEINGNSFADFRDKVIGICEKYSIPYYDAWAESGLNFWNNVHLDNYFIIRDGNTTGDGTHPNTEGYKRYYVPQLISLFEKIMPR